MPDVYIDTDNAAGGRDGSSSNPYNSLNEAWEAEDSNIDNGETWNFFCRGTAADTTAVVIDGWPTSGTAADTFVNIYPWHTDFGATSDADDGWYQGDDNYSTAHYRLEYSGSSNFERSLELATDGETGATRQITVQGLQFRSTGTFPVINIGIGYTASNVAGSYKIIGNRLIADSTGNFNRTLRVDTAGSQTFDVDIINNLFVSRGGTGTSAMNLNEGSDSTINVVNNTHISSNSEDTIDDVTGTGGKVLNNVAHHTSGTSTEIEFDLTSMTNSGFNANLDSGSRGTGGWDVADADFTSLGTNNTSENTPAGSQTNDWGSDLGGSGGSATTNADDSDVPTDDIRGNARNTAAGTRTAAGCFAASGEGAAGGGGVAPLHYHHRHHNLAG